MFNRWLENNDLDSINFDTRLFEKAGNRKYWDCVMTDTQIKTAQAYLGFEWPLIRASHFMDYQKNGNRLSQEKPHFARRYALLHLFLGELAEYKGRFMPDIVDGIFAICEETYWGLSAHYSPTRLGELIPSASDPYIDLFAAETAELLSVIYHVMYDELYAYCPLIIERIEYELERRIVTPYINRGDFWWMGRGVKKVNNWTPWILANIFTVLVCLGVKKSRLDYAVKKIFFEAQVYYDTMPDDGGCDEGASYWTKAAAKLFELCDAMYITSGGKINLFSDKKFIEMGLYETRVHIHGCNFVNFADGIGAFKDSNIDYALYGFGLRAGLPEMCRLAATLKRAQCRDDSQPTLRGSAVKTNLFSIIYAKDIDACEDFCPKDYVVLSDLQNMFLRKNGWFLAAKGGHNKEAHNHNDVGSFIAYFDNAPVLIDPGCGVYSKKTFSPQRYEIWTMQSLWHNLPSVNGKGQKDGIDYRADRFDTEDGKCTISFAKAYEDAGLRTLTRTLEITDAGLEICDSFEFLGDDNTVSEHFITPLSVEIKDGYALIGGAFTLSFDTDCEISVDSQGISDDSKLKGSWDTDRLYRIAFKIKTGKKLTIKGVLKK